MIEPQQIPHNPAVHMALDDKQARDTVGKETRMVSLKSRIVGMQSSLAI